MKFNVFNRPSPAGYIKFTILMFKSSTTCLISSFVNSCAFFPRCASSLLAERVKKVILHCHRFYKLVFDSADKNYILISLFAIILRTIFFTSLLVTILSFFFLCLFPIYENLDVRFSLYFCIVGVIKGDIL